MMLRKTNIELQLQRNRKKGISEADILNEVRAILEQDNALSSQIADRLSDPNHTDSNDFEFDLLETNNIYHISQIKKVCIDYRLRFLDTKYFKGKIPQEAISKIKQLEKSHQTTLNGFKIVAPSKLFKLDNADDPLLFAPMGNGYYYLIHKWGNDLSPLRRWMMLPFKNLGNLVFATILLSFFATALVPDGLFSHKMTSSEVSMIFFFMFKFIGAIVLYYAFAAGKNFNSAIWDSKYFNA